MLDAEGLKLQDFINLLQKQDTKMNNALKKIVDKYFTENTSVGEIVFFYRAVQTRDTSHLCFNLRSWSYQIDMKKAEEFFEKNFDDLVQFKPKGFPLKRTKTLTTKIDELDLIIRKHKVNFWSKYCVPLLEKRNANEILRFTNYLMGDGVYSMKSALYTAQYFLENNEEEEYQRVVRRRLF